MLFSETPTANICLSARPIEGAFAIFLAVFKVTFVSSPIHPCFDAFAFHFAEAELTLILLIEICKVVLAKTLKLSIDEIALVIGAIFPLKRSISLFLAFKELANICGAWFSRFAPGFDALSMLQVIHPVSLVLGLTIDIDEYSEAVGSVVKPLPLINVSVGMSHSTAAIGLSMGPHSLVFAAVGPELHTDSFSLASLLIPLPLIELALSHVLEFVDIYTKRCFFFQLAMETATDFAEC